MPKSVKRVNRAKRFTRKQNGGGSPFAGMGWDSVGKAEINAPQKPIVVNTTAFPALNVSGASPNVWNANAEFKKAKNTGKFCSSFNDDNTRALKNRLLEDDDWLNAGTIKGVKGKNGCVLNAMKQTA